MVPPYHNLVPVPPLPFNLELSGDHGDHDQQYRHLFNLEVPQSSFNSASTLSLSSPVFLTPAQVVEGQITDHYRKPQDFQFQLLEADHHNIVSYGGSCDGDHQTLENEAQKGTLLKLTISRNGNGSTPSADHHRHGSTPGANHDEINTSSVKWMSSKMRMIRKMANPDQTMSSSSTTTSSDDKTNVPIIRVCSDCSTTKTPLWRSGPRGPKSLCNACGIRQRKARRAMAAAAAAASGATLAAVAAPSMKATAATTTTSSKVQQKDNKSSPKSTLPFKKRCNNKLITPSPARGRPKKLCLEDHFTITMNNNNNNNNNNSNHSSATATATASTLQAVFPQDEKEAAILLMALSCGLVHG